MKDRKILFLSILLVLVIIGWGALTLRAVYIIAEEVVCGDGICDEAYGENYENCPQDCPPPPEVAPAPAAPAITPAALETLLEQILEELLKIPKERIGVVVEAITLELYQGETTQTSVAVTNNLGKEAIIAAIATGEVTDFISFVAPSLRLLPGEEGNFLIRIYIPPDTVARTYSGLIVFQANAEKAEVPVHIHVLKTTAELLDLRISILTPTVEPGKTARVQVDLWNMGRVARIDVGLTLQLIDLETLEVLNEYKETLALETTLSVIRPLDVPEGVEEKRYMIKAIADFVTLNRTISVSAFALFDVAIPLLARKIFGIPLATYLTFSTLAGVAGGTSYVVWRRRKLEFERRRRYRELLELRELPTVGPDAAFVGELAEVGGRTFIYLSDLMTHAMIAGATGCGKTIAAMILAEEALMKGKNVIVFDPTAQWTGFLRACKDKHMLSLYRRFGMRRKEARAFAGRIKIVEDPREEINIKELLFAKEPQITIFYVGALKPEELDLFIANTIRTVFAARLPESRELKALMIYDEVHRLLPRFGGRGLGFIQIERGVREFRKWGIGLVLISQVLADFVGAIKANIGMEIQMRTRFESDLDRVERKYGKDIAVSVVKAAVGTGMLVFSEYNRGRPYFIAFRPILHRVRRLSDAELAKYKQFDERIETLKYQLAELRKRGVDTFDIEVELGLAESRLAAGAFDMVRMYLESIEPRVTREWEKLGLKPPPRKKRIVEEKRIRAAVRRAEIARKRYLVKRRKKLSLEILEDKYRDLKALLEEARTKGKDVFVEEVELERVPAELRIVKETKEEKGLWDIDAMLSRIEKSLKKKLRG